MIIEPKTVTFHIANRAYSVNIGSDLDDEIINGIEKFINLDEEISVNDLLLAYLQKNAEFISFKKDIENTVQDLNNFQNKIQN